jgi:hypothetical protein
MVSHTWTRVAGVRRPVRRPHRALRPRPGTPVCRRARHPAGRHGAAVPVAGQLPPGPAARPLPAYLGRVVQSEPIRRLRRPSETACEVDVDGGQLAAQASCAGGAGAMDGPPEREWRNHGCASLPAARRSRDRAVEPAELRRRRPAARSCPAGTKGLHSVAGYPLCVSSRPLAPSCVTPRKLAAIAFSCSGTDARSSASFAA